jgi:HTH-type transcriptional regulator/antitoxin HigA
LAVLKSIAATDTAREMVRRKWVQPKPSIGDKVVERGEAVFAWLFCNQDRELAPARFRGRKAGPRPNLVEEIATRAWLAHVSECALDRRSKVKFKASGIDDEFIRHVAKLSVFQDGPSRALDELRNIGIFVVTESALPGMSMDGASFHPAGLGPVIGLTLRHDRLDNFWFTLFHEIGHIVLHLSSPSEEVFVDSTEDGAGDEIEAEAEANAFAKDGLIPRDAWMRSDAFRHGNESGVVSLARQLGIHAAIVAGRVRHERREYRMLHNLVGAGEVRDQLLAE